MAPVDDSLAGELPVPEVGRRDGVGVCVFSTGGVAPVEVGGENTGIQRVSWCLELEDWAKADVISTVVVMSCSLMWKDKCKTYIICNTLFQFSMQLI